MTFRALSAVASIVVSLFATPAAAEPPVWVVRDADSTIVLFGAVHVLPKDLAWRPKALDDALAHADDLWFETPVDADSQAEASRAAQANGYLSGDQTLEGLLTPTARDRLARVTAKLGLAPGAASRMRPWLADVMLGVLALNQQGASVDNGVERALAAAAPAATRRAFETSTQQIAFFADAPMADQLASLEDTLRQLDEDPGFYTRLIDAWARGDTGALEALGLTPMKQVSLYLYDQLIVQRNRRWAEAIATRLAGSGETVMVVGVGHLVGPDSVPALLRARGLSVEGP